VSFARAVVEAGGVGSLIASTVLARDGTSVSFVRSTRCGRAPRPVTEPWPMPRQDAWRSTDIAGQRPGPRATFRLYHQRRWPTLTGSLVYLR